MCVVLTFGGTFLIMSCSCDNLWKSAYFALIFFVFFLNFLWGIILLGKKAVPEFQNYRKEEQYHVRTQCIIESVNVSTVNDCTYDVDEEEIHSTYPCVQVIVSYDGSVKGHLFRSTEDAKDTQHQCVAYECEKSGSIFTYVDNLTSEFGCFYNPQKPYFVYLELKEGWLVYFTFACFIIIVVSPVLVFLCCWCKLSMPKLSTMRWSNCRTYVSRRKQLRKEERLANVVSYIRNGQTNNVKKNLKSDKINTELNTNGSELSPLALAAQYGQHGVLVDLIRRGADIRYVQESTGKTILHFACENGKREIIGFCLRYHAPINALDHMKKTPLMTYVEIGLSTANAVATLKHLIKIRADVTLTDKDNYSALHYACKTTRLSNRNTKREIISVLIRAGCIFHNATSSIRNYQTYPYDDSPLCVLFYHGEFTLGSLLIEAGYDLMRDRGLPLAIPFLPRHVQDMLAEEQQSPFPLLRLCRTRIRKSLGGIRVQQKLKLLPIPKRLIQFLRLKLY